MAVAESVEGKATLDFSGMRKYLCDKLSESSTSLNFVYKEAKIETLNR